MISFLAALQFLTVIPIKLKSLQNNKIAGSLAYFPLVGLCLGIFLSGLNLLFSWLSFRQLSIDILIIIILAYLSGCMHLDGLSDTLDAILSRKDKQGMLKIMRDSHAGVMGAAATFSILLIKISLLYSVAIHLKFAALILMCTLSRWTLVLTMFFFAYARQEGKAKVFIDGITTKIIIVSSCLAFAICGLVWQLKGILIMALAGGIAYLIGKYFKNKFGGITGDTLGATNEIVEAFVLLTMAILGKGVLG